MDVRLGTASLPALGSAVNGGNAAPEANHNAQPATLRPAQQPAAAERQTLSLEGMQQIASQINEFLKSSASNVEFTLDSGSDKIIVRIVNSQTNQLIRQIPSEEMLAISRSMDRMSGLLLQNKA